MCAFGSTSLFCFFFRSFSRVRIEKKDKGKVNEREREIGRLCVNVLCISDGKMDGWIDEEGEIKQRQFNVKKSHFPTTIFH